MNFVAAFFNINTGQIAEEPRRYVHPLAKKSALRAARIHLTKNRKEEADLFHAEYLNDLRLIYNLPKTPLAWYLLSVFRPLRLTTQAGIKTVWRELFIYKHYPTEYSKGKLEKRNWL